MRIFNRHPNMFKHPDAWEKYIVNRIMKTLQKNARIRFKAEKKRDKRKLKAELKAGLKNV